MKMVNVDINPFGDHDKVYLQPDEHPNETILFTPGEVGGVIEGGSTWEPERETSFGGTSVRTKLQREDVVRLYKKLSETYHVPEERHFDVFEVRNGELYCKGVDKPLMYKKGRLRMVGELDKILGITRLQDLGFDIPRGELTAQQAVILNKAEEELPSASDIEFQEIMENVAISTDNLIEQLDGSEDLPMHELIGLDKQLRSIRGSLKVETTKKVKLRQCTDQQKHRLEESKTIQNMTMVFEKTSRSETKGIMTN